MPLETQFLLLELEAGEPYALLLPLIDSDKFRGTLRPPRWVMGDGRAGRARFLPAAARALHGALHSLLAHLPNCSG